MGQKRSITTAPTYMQGLTGALKKITEFSKTDLTGLNREATLMLKSVSTKKSAMKVTKTTKYC